MTTPLTQKDPHKEDAATQQIGSASNRKWGRSECFVCGQLISTCGLGHVSHMRTHVRQGKVEETWSEGGKHKEFNWTGIWKP